MAKCLGCQDVADTVRSYIRDAQVALVSHDSIDTPQRVALCQVILSFSPPELLHCFSLVCICLHPVSRKARGFCCTSGVWPLLHHHLSLHVFALSHADLVPRSCKACKRQVDSSAALQSADAAHSPTVPTHPQSHFPTRPHAQTTRTNMASKYISSTFTLTKTPPCNTSNTCPANPATTQRSKCFYLAYSLPRDNVPVCM